MSTLVSKKKRYLCCFRQKRRYLYCTPFYWTMNWIQNNFVNVQTSSVNRRIWMQWVLQIERRNNDSSFCRSSFTLQYYFISRKLELLTSKESPKICSYLLNCQKGEGKPSRSLGWLSGGFLWLVVN